MSKMSLWLSQVNNFYTPVDMKTIAMTIESLSQALQGVGTDLTRIDKAQPNPQHLVAILRTSFVVRHQLEGWFELRDFAWNYLPLHGFDSARVMKGLV